MDNKGVADLDHVEALKPPAVSAQNHGDVLLVSSEDVRRIPVPTDNPNDPLNSKPWKKFVIVANCCWFGKLAARTEPLEIFHQHTLIIPKRSSPS